ncbi:MAG: phosphatidate cytidylyltransferase [Burkholderiales bacterium]|jgi:phosphatidate cytidylyltransferase|nr:phosphatidate cytidylyltransferase [Burkholderiales bacterium]
MLKTRVVTAVVLAAVFLGALFLLPAFGWTLFALGIAGAAAYEWAGFARLAPPARIAYALSSAALAAGLAWMGGLPAGEWRATGLTPVYAAAALFWALGAGLWLVRLPQAPPPALVLVLGWIVLVPTVLALVQLRNAGPVPLLLLMAIVWIADIAAYFSGRAFGKRKLAPRVSPGKSWEGVIGAFIATTLYAVLWHTLAPAFLPGLPAPLAGLAAFVALVWALTGASVLGDLFESALKRQAGLKDSSRLLPGHGGVLDRIDALTPVLPIAALVLSL